MSQATVPCGLTPKLFCFLVDSVISEVGEQGRCTPHIPKLLSPPQFWGGCSGTAVGSLPTARRGATLQTRFLPHRESRKSDQWLQPCL